MSSDDDLLLDTIQGLAKRYPWRSRASIHWRYHVLPVGLLVLATAAGSDWLPAHPRDFFLRPTMLYVVIAVAAAICRESALLTALGGLVLLVVNFLIQPEGALLWALCHGAQLALLSYFFAIRRRSWRTARP